MGDLCANCGRHTPCADYGGTFVCCDEEMCRQNQRINSLIRERNAAIEKNVTLVRILRDHHSWIAGAMQVLRPLQDGWMSPSTFETAAAMLASVQVAPPADDQSDYEVLRDAIVDAMEQVRAAIAKRPTRPSGEARSE